MKRALELAKLASDEGETPVGAVIVRSSDGKIVGEGRNTREKKRNALCHAEIAAINEACKTLGGWRLSGCVLYCTLEPCPMCAGAVINARIDKVVFGAYDKKAGSVSSVANMFDLPYNHRPVSVSGVMQTECEDVLRIFFRKLRSDRKMNKVKLIPVETDEQIAVLAAIADEVWHEWFPRILSDEQIDYMVEKFQSVPALTMAIREDGYKYFYIHSNGVHMGFTGFHIEEDGRMFLSKIYLKAAYRGKGFARDTFNQLISYCKENGLRAIWLTVNKYNDNSIAVYEKIGFKRIGDGVTDIGNGYVMDDYFYELDI
jgi:tRNA(adenine34) deaminase